MLRVILKREILHNLYSLRFFVSLALVLALFIAGSLSFVRSHEAALEKDRIARAEFVERMKADAANTTRLAVTRRDYPLRPRDNGFISDAKEKYLPNAISFSAWNVFSFRNKAGSINPVLVKYDELSWSLIGALVVSFITLLFTFDAVSGEKETKTLALTLSNPIPRATLFLGKYLSAVVSVLIIVGPGVLLSDFILLLSGQIGRTASLAEETIGFLVVTALLISTMAAFGLLGSVIARSSNISLILVLSFWLLFAAVIPNSSSFIARNLFPIDRADSVQAKINRAFDDLYKSAPAGSFTLISGNPFIPQHELRASLQMKLLQAEKAIRDAYSRDAFRQFERTRFLTALSPVAVFEVMTEAVSGGGYSRFRKVWGDLHVYQGQLLAFFKALDAQDPKSPHWYNPYQNVSTTRNPVAFETIPQFIEKPMSFAERIKPKIKYLVINVLYTCLVFFLSFILFVRYDVR